MKVKSIISGLVLFVSLFACAPNPTDILQKSYDKCQSIKQGYYEMTKIMKYMSSPDTFKYAFKCHFRKIIGDTLFSGAFHFQSYYNNEYGGEIMYTGNELVSCYTFDSTATIMSKSKWTNDIISIRHNFTFYNPLFDWNSYPIQHGNALKDGSLVFLNLGDKIINNFACYHLQVNETPKIEAGSDIKTLRVEYQYWISKSDLIPVQYSITQDFVMNGDTMTQYEKYCLNKYDLETKIDEKTLTINSIPALFKLQDYVPYKRPDPLPKDTIAPGWELTSLNNEKVNLKNLKGSLVLIDFFYKSCYPCMQALPALQALHEKYKDKGLHIIGIDPYDTIEKDEINKFLSKRGVTYTILLGGKQASSDYRVSGYPTMYLIDKQGKILFTQIGYGKEVDKILEDLILKNL